VDNSYIIFKTGNFRAVERDFLRLLKFRFFLNWINSIRWSRQNQWIYQLNEQSSSWIQKKKTGKNIRILSEWSKLECPSKELFVNKWQSVKKIKFCAVHQKKRTKKSKERKKERKRCTEKHVNQKQSRVNREAAHSTVCVRFFMIASESFFFSVSVPFSAHTTVAQPQSARTQSVSQSSSNESGDRLVSCYYNGNSNKELKKNRILIE